MADNISQISTLATETADATATAAQVLAGAKAYAKGVPVVGTMPNNGGPSTAIAAGRLKDGYTTGGVIANLVAGNIKSGVTIGGIAGALSGLAANTNPACTTINSVALPSYTRTMADEIVAVAIKWNSYIGFWIVGAMAVYRGSGYDSSIYNITTSMSLSCGMYRYTLTNNRKTLTISTDGSTPTVDCIYIITKSAF